jgi:hypothetical protein
MPGRRVGAPQRVRMARATRCPSQLGRYLCRLGFLSSPTSHLGGPGRVPSYPRKPPMSSRVS